MFKRLAVLSALAVGSVSIAHATSISGTLGLTGVDGFTVGTTTVPGTITFTSATINGTSCALTCTNTGTFSVLTSGNPVSMFPTFSGPLPYLVGNNLVPSLISPVEVVTTTEGGITFDFFMTDYNAMIVSQVTGCTAPSPDTATCLNVTGDGFFTATGFTPTPGSFTFTTQEDSGPNGFQQSTTTFSASAIANPTSTPVPEPASLALVGSGIIGLAGLARRKFASVQ